MLPAVSTAGLALALMYLIALGKTKQSDARHKLENRKRDHVDISEV